MPAGARARFVAARPHLLAALAAAAAAAIFIPSLHFGFLAFDDPMFLASNTHWCGLGGEAWRWAWFSHTGGVYQPLAWLSWSLDYALWGFDARGYHLQNVLWHALTAGLALYLARRLLSLAQSSRARDPGWMTEAAAFFSALVFAVHPLRVESVTWVAERRDTMCGAFSLAALLLYLNARRPGRPPGPLTPTAAFLLLALTAKAMAVTLPIVMIILDVYPLARIGPRLEGLDVAVREKWPLFLEAGIFALIGMSVQDRLHLGWDQHGAVARMAQSAYALVFYVRKSVWPSGLAPLYELRPPLHWMQGRFLASAVAAASGAWACARWRRARPWLSAAAAAYAVQLLPVSGLFQFGPQLVADRYSYLPCLPLAFLAGAAFRAGLRRHRLVSIAAAVAIAAALAAGTVVQQSYWRTSAALWSRVLEVDPGSSMGQLGLGTALLSSSRVSEAQVHFRAALAAYPDCVSDQDRLAERFAAGDRSSAESVRLSHDVETHPVCRLARANLGAALAMGGEMREAQKVLRIVAAVSPDDEKSRINLARIEAALRGSR